MVDANNEKSEHNLFMPNPKAYLDISIDDDPIGRIVLELFQNKAPKTVNNFLEICKGTVNLGNHKITYKGNCIRKVVKNFMIQTDNIFDNLSNSIKLDDVGDVNKPIFTIEQNNNDSWFNEYENENMSNFNHPFYIAMSNPGSACTQNLQFFITTCVSPHLDGKHTIFGQVIKGKSVVRTIEHIDVDNLCSPLKSIVIEDCGVWNETMEIPLYNACNDTVGGDDYEEYPEDDKKFDGDDFEKAYDAIQIIKESGTLLFKKKDFQNAIFKYKKSLRYLNEYIPEMDLNKDLNLRFNLLKMKLYLNICLCYFNMKSYDESIKFSTYLLEMDGVSLSDQSKAFYRRGNCYLAKNMLDSALLDYQSSKEKNPESSAIQQKIDYTKKLLKDAKEKNKKNMAKFFQ